MSSSGMPNHERKRLDLSSAKKKSTKLTESKAIERQEGEDSWLGDLAGTFTTKPSVKPAPAPVVSEEKAPEVPEEKTPETSEDKTSKRPRLSLSKKKKKAEKKEEPTAAKEEAPKKAAKKEEKKQEVKEEVLQTPADRIMGALDGQLSAMGRLAKGEPEAEKSLVEQKMELLEKQMTDMRRLILETSQSTIVNGLGAS